MTGEMFFIWLASKQRPFNSPRVVPQLLPTIHPSIHPSRRVVGRTGSELLSLSSLQRQLEVKKIKLVIYKVTRLRSSNKFLSGSIQVFNLSQSRSTRMGGWYTARAFSVAGVRGARRVDSSSRIDLSNDWGKSVDSSASDYASDCSSALLHCIALYVMPC